MICACRSALVPFASIPCSVGAHVPCPRGHAPCFLCQALVLLFVPHGHALSCMTCSVTVTTVLRAPEAVLRLTARFAVIRRSYV
ncbi:MAG: hypothetical protein ACK56I_09155, partial [bacterium]